MCHKYTTYTILKTYEYASETFMPNDKYYELKKVCFNKYFNEDKVKQFAENIGVHPEIVVGRLQNDKLIAYSALNK
ncbi:hypothetical protein AN643_03485 [Candidatus Epulonipiscioides saccharophilum]|nr:hypothetical protein AN643_03485 [Epulopiscium sp. SCG-B10WGA-EpuloB]